MAAANSGIVLLLPWVEAQVLQQEHVTRLHRRDGRDDRRADDFVRGLLDRLAEQFAEPGGDLVHRQVLALLGRGLFRPAEVAHGDDRGAGVEQLADRRQRRADAAVVLHRAGLLVERHVEIDADQDLLALQVAQVVDASSSASQYP